MARIGWLFLIVVALISAGGAWVAHLASLEPAAPSDARGRRALDREARSELFAALQPVKLKNCEFKRFGEPNDGGYLLCGNLLGGVRSAYSYGISGYDGWGCEVSTALGVPVHQYDCFNTKQPSCPTGRPVFHAECIAGAASTDSEGRIFDALQSQLLKNGDADKHIVVKMDVEGAEWDSILKTPDDVFERIDQIIFEFHGVNREPALHLATIAKLKQHFELVNLHFNNYSCVSSADPFPAWAYEVTFVNKRLAQVDPSAKAELPNPLDTPNNPRGWDCQARPLR